MYGREEPVWQHRDIKPRCPWLETGIFAISSLGQARGQFSFTFTKILEFMKQEPGPNRDMPAPLVSGEQIDP